MKINPESSEIDGGLFPIKHFCISCPSCYNAIYFANAEDVDPRYHEWMAEHYKKKLIAAYDLLQTYNEFINQNYLSDEFEAFKKFKQNIKGDFI